MADWLGKWMVLLCADESVMAQDYWRDYSVLVAKVQRAAWPSMSSGGMRLHCELYLDAKHTCCGLRSGYMRLHLVLWVTIRVLRCGLRSGYMRLHYLAF